MNGERIGEGVLDTARTDDEERVLYATYDVTDALEAAAADVDTVRGVVSVAWERGDGFELEVSIPAAADATVRAPRFGGTVRVDGTPLEAIDDADLEVRERAGDRVVVDVGPGDRTFTA